MKLLRTIMYLSAFESGSRYLSSNFTACLFGFTNVTIQTFLLNILLKLCPQDKIYLLTGIYSLGLMSGLYSRMFSVINQYIYKPFFNRNTHITNSTTTNTMNTTNYNELYKLLKELLNKGIVIKGVYMGTGSPNTDDKDEP